MEFIVEDGSIVEGANSLLSVQDALAAMWFDPFRGDAWQALDEETQEKYLVTATRFLVLNFDFNGMLVEEGQPLPFPRRYMINSETGFYFPDNVVPKRVKEAVLELALWILERKSANFNTTDDVTLVRTEDVEIAFDPKAGSNTLPGSVIRLLSGMAEYLGGGVSHWKIRRA